MKTPSLNCSHQHKVGIAGFSNIANRKKIRFGLKIVS
jgi:hypothetical protein